MEFEDFNILSSDAAYTPFTVQQDLSEFFSEQFIPTTTETVQHETSSPTPLLPTTTAVNENSRCWRLIHVCPRLFLSQSNFSQTTVSQLLDLISVSLKTRSENITHKAIPDRLYSSLKYVLEAKVSDTLFETNVVMMSVQVVDSKNPEQELLKNNSNEKLIKGVADMTALSRNHGNFETKCKIQFTDVSYHHEKKHFAFKVSLFEPDRLHEGPSFVMVSAPFCVYARRPTQTKQEKKKTNKTNSNTDKTTKRARKQEVEETTSEEETEQDLLQTPPKKQKVMPPVSLQKVPSPVYQDFVKCLNLLAAFKQALPEEEREIANRLVQDALFSHNAA